jgi:hypothetical protein
VSVATLSREAARLRAGLPQGDAAGCRCRTWGFCPGEGESDPRGTVCPDCGRVVLSCVVEVLAVPGPAGTTCDSRLGGGGAQS